MVPISLSEQKVKDFWYLKKNRDASAFYKRRVVVYLLLELLLHRPLPLRLMLIMGGHAGYAAIVTNSPSSVERRIPDASSSVESCWFRVGLGHADGETLCLYRINDDLVGGC